VVAGWSLGRLAASASAAMPIQPPSATNAKWRVAASTLRFRWTWNVNEPTGTRSPSTSTPQIARAAVSVTTPRAVAPTASAVGKKLYAGSSATT